MEIWKINSHVKKVYMVLKLHEDLQITACGQKVPLSLAELYLKAVVFFPYSWGLLMISSQGAEWSLKSN